MKGMRKLSAILLAVMLCVGMINIPVFAAETTQDGLEVTLITDKEEYSQGEEITATLTVKNTNDFSVKNVKMEQMIPEGYDLIKNAESTKQVESLKTGETITLSVVYEPEIVTTGGNTDEDIDESSDETSDETSTNVETGDNNNIINIIFLLVILIVSAVVIGIIIFRRKNGKKRILSLFLSVVLLDSIVLGHVTPVEAKTLDNKVELENMVKVGNSFVSINGSVDYQITIDDEDENYCKVEYVLLINDEKVENAERYRNIYVSKGEKVSRPENPISKYAEFEDWYTGLDVETKYDFDTPITEDVAIFAKWSFDTTDTDGDGIYDSIEEDLGTDPKKVDTDGDGLNDYIEKIISTDPLKVDTDGDSVSDYDEDADGDTLTNGYEVEIGTKPEHEDSDLDGLKDNEEINEYGTDPLKEDTDNDGASDIWEINNGFDPLVANSSFEVNASSEEVNEYNLTSASVDIEIDGEQVGSLSIAKVNYAENPLVRETLPGYMGSAYDFSIEGTFEKATMSFEYNVDVYGEPDDEFQPRIYYLNEELGCFEELPNQTVANGRVTVTVSHFSTYILLNKVEFDKIWETEIKPPEYTGEGQKKGLDVVLAIDSSGSMDNNDRQGLRKEAAKSFVEKLGENDRAAIIDFDSYSSVICALTNDKEQMKSAINSIDSWGGTNLSYPVSDAINILTKDEDSASKYKFIILLTDGEGSYDHSYSQMAAENDIQIYTIGLGYGVDEYLLKKIAEDTGGSYYFASAADDLLDIYETTAGETIDYVTDSNDDGISDYYTQLIYEGKMPMADHLKGVDLSKSTDYDGDGLKNGEEIKIINSNNRVYLKMFSNPSLKHSDRDGVNDYDEVQRGTSPLYYTLEKNAVDYLTDDDYYYAPDVTDDYQDGGFDKFIVDANAAIYIVWNRPEVYRDIMIDYFANYSKESYLDDVAFEATRTTMLNTLSNILGWFEPLKENGADYYDCFNKIIDLIDLINGTTNKADLYLIYQQYETIIEQIAILFPDNTIVVQTRAISTSKLVTINISKLGKNVGKVCNGITYAVSVLDLVDTIESFSAVSANNMAFEQNMDILQNIIEKSPDEDAVDAAKDIKNKLAGGYTEEVKAIVSDVAENAIPMIAETIMMKNPYTATIVVVRNGIALITGIAVDLKQHFQMFSYTELTRAAIRLLNSEVSTNNSYYEALSYGNEIDEMLNRYLTHVAQLRILGEKMFCNWQEEDGIIGWFTDNSDWEKEIDRIIKNVKEKADELNLKLSSKL